MKVGRFFYDLLFPPRCISCRAFCKKDILDPSDAPFCEKCRLDWEKEKTACCAGCGKELLNCRCTSSRMERAGIKQSVKLVFYQSERDTVGRRSILHLKRNRNRRAFDFFAAQLAFPLNRLIAEKGFSAEEIRFCYVPRSHKSEESQGLDQAECLCRAIAKRYGTTPTPLLYRSGAEKAEQKTLSAREREKNVKRLFALDEAVFPKIGDARCIVIVDDVITTGASVSACASLLKGRFPGEILALSLARTPLLRRRAAKTI